MSLSYHYFICNTISPLFIHILHHSLHITNLSYHSPSCQNCMYWWQYLPIPWPNLTLKSKFYLQGISLFKRKYNSFILVIMVQNIYIVLKKVNYFMYNFLDYSFEYKAFYTISNYRSTTRKGHRNLVVLQKYFLIFALIFSVQPLLLLRGTIFLLFSAHIVFLPNYIRVNQPSLTAEPLVF